MGGGACSAVIADAADAPGPVFVMGRGRAVVIPAMGSALVAGHSPFGALVLRAAHAASLALTVPVAAPFTAGALPLTCGGADMVACDDSEDDEFCRCALFRGMNTPPPFVFVSAVHAWRLMLAW
jgi:hypothetical protein